MITRLVKMHFLSEKTSEFTTLFNQYKQDIAGFPGCLKLELMQDIGQADVFFTYSVWDSEESLNKYRESALFEKVWGRTRQLFKYKPEAWSMEVLFSSIH